MSNYFEEFLAAEAEIERLRNRIEELEYENSKLSSEIYYLEQDLSYMRDEMHSCDCDKE